MTATDGSGHAAASTTETPKLAANQVLLGADIKSVDRPSARKATRAFDLIRQVTRQVPDLQAEMAQFVSNYEKSNSVELSRVQARAEFPQRPLRGEDGPLVYPATMPGTDEPHPQAGQVVYAPSLLDSMTEEDWERSGHVFRMPRSPRGEEVAAAMFDHALEHAETLVYRLLALFTVDNQTIKAWESAGRFDEELTEYTSALLDDAFADQFLELAAVVAEQVDVHFIAKMRALRGRLGKFLSVFTGDTTAAATATPANTNSGSTESEPTSSTPSDGPTDGHPTTSSDSTGAPSSPASSESSTTTNGNLPSEEPVTA